MTWTVSLFDNLYRTDADQRCLSGAELVDLLTTPGEEFQLTNKALLPMWSAAVFSPRRRKKAHVQSLSCLVLDYDESTTLAVGLVGLVSNPAHLLVAQARGASLPGGASAEPRRRP